MADQADKDRIRDALVREYFRGPNDFIDISDGYDDAMHVVLVSRRFDDMREKEQIDLVWDLLEKHLPQELWSRITLLQAVSPERVKSI